VLLPDLKHRPTSAPIRTRGSIKGEMGHVGSNLVRKQKRLRYIGAFIRYIQLFLNHLFVFYLEL
jgi:hypothetical protein